MARNSTPINMTTCESGQQMKNGKCEWCQAGYISKSRGSMCQACPVTGSEGNIASITHNQCISQSECTSTSGASVITVGDRKQCICTTDGYVLKNNSCQTCGANQVANGGQQLCVCVSGYGLPNNDESICVKCEVGSYHVYDDTETEKQFCTECKLTETVNLAANGCVTTCGPNTEVKDRMCVCKSGFTLNADKTRCVAPETGASSFAAVAIILLVVSFVVISTAVAVVEVVRRKKAQMMEAAEAEVL